MVFEAGRPSSDSGTAQGFQAIWRAHGLLHKTDNIVIPLMLLVASVCMAMYQHVANKGTGDTSTRNFLVLIFLSMIPVAVLEKRLMACTDPVGTISRFSPKVLMMHMLFLVIRFVTGLLTDDFTRLFTYRTRASLVAACALLPTVYGCCLSRACLWEHRDVVLLAGVALGTAITTEWADAYMKGFFTASWFPSWHRATLAQYMLSASSDYLEILAFVPAMWMACREERGAVNEPNVADTRRRALALFAYVLSFYTLEDLHSAFAVGADAPIAAAAHVAHFLLLLDFSAYILSHLYDPTKYEKIMNKLWGLVSDSAAV